MNWVEQLHALLRQAKNLFHASPVYTQECSYEDWRDRFTRNRLKITFLLGSVINLSVIPLDYFLYSEHFAAFLPFRIAIGSGLVLGWWLVQQDFVDPRWLVTFTILNCNACIIHMGHMLGGFVSTYFFGVILVFLIFSVLVPVFVANHFIAQLGSLIYYFLLNSAFATSSINWNAAAESTLLMFLICGVVLCSVYLFEQLQRSEYQARQGELEARSELQASNTKLRELDRLKNDFFANISHELRTPLTLILGTFNRLRTMFPRQEGSEVIQSGKNNAYRLLSLINELLELTKFDSGSADVQKTTLDFSELIRSVAANFESSDAARVHLYGVEESRLIEADPRHMKTVLYNLLSNAFKFQESDHGEVWIRLAEKNGWISLDVEDNGIGIPQEAIPKIFDRFVQVERSQTRRFEGTGIGLALVREIIASHGGRISVTSSIGRGTCFTISLPQGDTRGVVHQFADEEQIVLETEPETSEGISSKDQTEIHVSSAPLVLLIDDNAEMRAYLRRVIGSHYRVREARDGADGLRQAKTDHPDLIVTDAMMPGMSGDEFLLVRQRDEVLQQIPVIMVTARAGTEARVYSLEAGADDYLVKPFDEQEILARVGNLLRARAQERELRKFQQERLTQFLPSHVAELVLNHGDAELRKGKRQEISVLFVDMRGFTAFVESAEPEDVLEVLHEYEIAGGRLIEQYQGTLDRFSGDAMIVYFNDSRPLAGHAQQAVRLALALRGALVTLQGRWKKRGFELGVGFGIATGYATIGIIGSETRKEYTVIGSVTNLAARLCEQARAGDILLTERVLEQLDSSIRSESMGEVRLKGFRNPVLIHNIIPQ